MHHELPHTTESTFGCIWEVMIATHDMKDMWDKDIENML